MRLLSRYAGLLGMARGLFGRSRGVARSWTLELPPPRPVVTGLRSASLPTVGDLLSALSEVGYEVAASRIDDSGELHGEIDVESPLPGADFSIRAEGIGRGNEVAVRIGRSPTAAKTAIGFVETGRRVDARGIELARFVISRLGRLFPGLLYKDMNSRTTADATEYLDASLPARPNALG